MQSLKNHLKLFFIHFLSSFLCQFFPEMLEEKLVEYQPWFDHLDTLKTNEKLRPENLKNDDILGFYGNFKKFDVD